MTSTNREQTDEIERRDEQNEMVKLEVVHSFAPGKKCYHWTILCFDMQAHLDDADILNDIDPLGQEH